ncbi:MAG TPA: TIM barrel protein [Acidobacteriota bacterium]|nr:TIM barrel protein [Acidobacteriota bacterium]
MDLSRREEELLVEKLSSRGLDVDEIIKGLQDFRLEVPSWGFMNTGTRFAVFEQPGIPGNLKERLDGLVEVKQRTGIADRMATIHPWDYEGADPEEIGSYARERGVSIASVTPALFQDPDFMLGSLTHSQARVRNKAVGLVLQALETGRAAGASVLSLWLPDGSDYPGQVDFRQRKKHLLDSLREIYDSLDGMEMLVEYKLFEPAFYHTDLSDWGMADWICRSLGGKARVLVDLGHHAHGVNIEHIVAFLHDEDRLGGFHVNNRKYADDDLTVGAVNPYEVFLILNEIVAGWHNGLRRDLYFAIDQSSGIKPKLGSLLQSVDAVHRRLAQALLVNRRRLRAARDDCNVIAAEECLKEAFQADVEPLLRMVRRRMGCSAEVLDARAAHDPRAGGAWREEK